MIFTTFKTLSLECERTYVNNCYMLHISKYKIILFIRTVVQFKLELTNKYTGNKLSNEFDNTIM